MCLQDIRIGRGVTPHPSVTNLPDATPVKLVDGAGDRISINIAIVTNLALATQKPVNIQLKFGSGLITVLSLTSILMHGLLKIDWHGIGICNEIWATNNVGLAVDVAVVDNRLVKSLEDTVEGR